MNQIRIKNERKSTYKSMEGQTRIKKIKKTKKRLSASNKKLARYIRHLEKEGPPRRL